MEPEAILCFTVCGEALIVLSREGHTNSLQRTKPDDLIRQNALTQADVNL